MSDEACESALNIILGITYSRQVFLLNVSIADKPSWFGLAIKIAPHSDSQPFTHNPSRGHFLLLDRKGKVLGVKEKLQPFAESLPQKYILNFAGVDMLLKQIRITAELACFF